MRNELFSDYKTPATAQNCSISVQKSYEGNTKQVVSYHHIIQFWKMVYLILLYSQEVRLELSWGPFQPEFSYGPNVPNTGPHSQVRLRTYPNAEAYWAGGGCTCLTEKTKLSSLKAHLCFSQPLCFYSQDVRSQYMFHLLIIRISRLQTSSPTSCQFLNQKYLAFLLLAQSTPSSIERIPWNYMC